MVSGLIFQTKLAVILPCPMASNWLQKYFLGAKSKKEAASLCDPQDMCLYYQRESVKALNLPLMLVYRDCRGRVFHLPVEKREDKWQLAWKNTIKSEELSCLLNHYVGRLLAHKGHDSCWEPFPVWTREFQQRFGA